MKKKVKYYCEECESKDIVKIATHVCPQCNFFACTKCAIDVLWYTCPWCEPPELVKIKK